jgi:voltage-gated potassium channel
MAARNTVSVIRELYFGHTDRAYRFRYALLFFDVVTILFVVSTSFLPRNHAIEALDLVIGLVVLADFSARMAVSDQRLRILMSPYTWADIAAIISFLAPMAGEGFGFLRILRTLRLLRTYQVAARLRSDWQTFRNNEDTLIAAINLGVFLFIMTGIVYETQHRTNSDIGNWADALYFTVTALTTTGFGDITLPGTTGRLIAVAIMIVGVTLFLRLAQVMFRPNKVRHECPTCGLVRHDPDAVHCKHCGTVLHIKTEGAV